VSLASPTFWLQKFIGWRSFCIHRVTEQKQMTLRIQPLPGLESTIFVLTGRMQHEHVAELQSLLDLQTSCEEFVLDLKELKLVDRESILFLAQREAEGMELRNCPPCVREWI
jgi:hypothetical protein